MARKRSRKQRAKQRASARKQRQTKRTQRQQTRQKQRTKRQSTRQQRRTERQAARQETKRARVAGKTARKQSQYEAGFAPGTGAVNVIKGVTEAVPTLAAAGGAIAGALGAEGAALDALSGIGGVTGAFDEFAAEEWTGGGGGGGSAFDEMGEAEQVMFPPKEPITKKAWFWPAVIGAPLILFAVTRRRNGRNGNGA